MKLVQNLNIFSQYLKDFTVDINEPESHSTWYKYNYYYSEIEVWEVFFVVYFKLLVVQT